MSSHAGIACGQLLAVCTAERRGWHWPTNKDARRLITASAVFGLGRVWPGDGDLNGDRIGKGSTCASTRLRVLLLMLCRCGALVAPCAAVALARLELDYDRTCTLPRLSVGGFLEMYHGTWVRRKAYFNMHVLYCYTAVLLVCRTVHKVHTAKQCRERTAEDHTCKSLRTHTAKLSINLRHPRTQPALKLHVSTHVCRGRRELPTLQKPLYLQARLRRVLVL